MRAVLGIISSFRPSDPPEPDFCTVPELAELFASGASSSIDGIEVTGTRTADTDAEQSAVTVGDTGTAFSSTTAIVQQNWIYDDKVSTAEDLGQPFAANLIFFDQVQAIPVAAVRLALRTNTGINTGNAIIDSLGTSSAEDVLHDDIAVDQGYEIALALDMSDGTVSYKDSANRSGSLKVSGSFNNENPHYGVILYNTGTTKNDSIVGKFNQGSEAFGVVIEGAVPHCEA